jgi:hypothetical protein
MVARYVALDGNEVIRLSGSYLPPHKQTQHTWWGVNEATLLSAVS